MRVGGLPPVLLTLWLHLNSGRNQSAPTEALKTPRASSPVRSAH